MYFVSFLDLFVLVYRFCGLKPDLHRWHQRIPNWYTPSPYFFYTHCLSIYFVLILRFSGFTCTPDLHRWHRRTPKLVHPLTVFFLYSLFLDLFFLVVRFSGSTPDFHHWNRRTPKLVHTLTVFCYTL